MRKRVGKPLKTHLEAERVSKHRDRQVVEAVGHNADTRNGQHAHTSHENDLKRDEDGAAAQRANESLVLQNTRQQY